MNHHHGHAHCPAPVAGTVVLDEIGPPDVIVELEARECDWRPAPGRPVVRAWGYNGKVPGPVIGSDGGLLEAPVDVTEVLLAPGDRVELAVGPFEWCTWSHRPA